MNKKFVTVASMVCVLLILTVQLAAQNGRNYQNERNYQNAQSRIRERLIREQGGNSPRVNFNNDGRFDSVGGNTTRVRGTGTYFRNQNDRGRNFSYDTVYDVRNGNISNFSYQFFGGGQVGGPGGFYPPTSGGGGGSTGGGGNGWGGGWGGNRPSGSVRYSGQLVNWNSNKCLDISDYGSSSDGTRIQQWSCSGQQNQAFDIISVGSNEYAIYNRATRKVFDVPDNQSFQDGAELQQYRWTGRPNQRFRLEGGNGGFRLISVASGKCIDVDSQSNSDGARVHQWNCGGQRSQVFRIR